VTNYVTSSSYWPNGVPWYLVRGSNNNVWSVSSFNARLQLQESYESINNQNTNPQMLFVSCPNWGVQTNGNWGAYNICPLRHFRRHCTTTTPTRPRRGR